MKVSCGVAPWKVIRASNCRAVGAASAEVVRRARLAVMVESFILTDDVLDWYLGRRLEYGIGVLKVV